MPLRFLIKPVITVETPPVIFNSFRLPVTHVTALEPPRDRRRVASLHFRDCTVLRRGDGGDGGATAVLVRYHGGHGGAAATPLRISPTRDDTAEVLNILKVSAVPPRSSAVLTVFGGATAINDGIIAEPRRSWRCHCGLCRTSTAVAPRLRCDGGSTAEARRNMLKVSAVPPRRSAVLTVFGGVTAINDGTTAELRRSWRCHGGLCRTSTAVAPRIRCDGGKSYCMGMFPMLSSTYFLCVMLSTQLSKPLKWSYHIISDIYLTSGQFHVVGKGW